MKRSVLTIAATLAIGLCAAVPSALGDASDCPSSGSKTLMLADGSNTENGYGCGYLDTWDYHSIGGWATQFWASYPALGYKYDYVCDHQTGDVDFIKVTTQGDFQTVDGKTVPVSAGSVTYTASNSASSTRHIAVGVIWNTGNPHDGTLPAPGIPPQGDTFSYTQNCGSPAGDIPSYVLYQSSVSLGSHATSVVAGSPFSVGFTSKLVSQSSGLPDGQPMYLQTEAPGGALTPKGCTMDVGTTTASCDATQQGLKGGGGVAASPDGKSVYVIGQFDNAIASFTRDTSGALTGQGCVADAGSTYCTATQQGLNGAHDVALSPDGKSVYVVGGNDDAITRFDRDTTTGALTPQGCIADAGSTIGCAKTQEGLDNPYGVAVSPDGKSVYVASYGDDALVRFGRDTATGALTPQGCIGDPGGQDKTACGPTQLGLLGAYGVTVSPDNKSVYVASEYGSMIARFDRDPSTGALTGQGCIARVGSTYACAAQQLGLKGASRVAVSPDGKSVYVTSQVDMAVVRFDRDTATGALTGQGCIADAGSTLGCAATQQGLQNAFGVTVSPDGRSVYVGAFGDNAVVRFDRSSAGALTPQGCIADAGSTIGCAATQEGLRAAGGIAISRDRASVYAVGGADNAVVHFDRPATWTGVAQTTTSDGAGTLTFKPVAAGTYTLRAVYPGLNVASPGRGYTPAVTDTFDLTVTAPPTSRRARVAAPWPAGSTVAVAKGSSAPPSRPTFPPRLGATEKSTGGLATVNSRFVVPQKGDIRSSFAKLACPRGYGLLNVEATSTGIGAPADGITVGRTSSAGVTLTISQAARGHRGMAQVLCRRLTARRVLRSHGFAYGTNRRDRIRVPRRKRAALGGAGKDHIVVTGARSSAAGGLGHDRILLRAAKTNASGGLGDDILWSVARRRTLLVGGPGRDRLIGALGVTLINAIDGRGGDTVICHSRKNRVAADPGDRLVGPCNEVTLR